jgi:hypothetical protein
VATFEPFLNSFTAGALSPLLDGRDDIDQYRRGARRLVNAIVLPHGGVERRPGTWYIDTFYNAAKRSRLVPFRYSVSNAYVIKFSEGVGHVFVNQARLIGASFSHPYTEAELADLQFAQEADVLYVVHPDHPPHKLTRTSPTTFAFAPVEFSNGRGPIGPYNVDPRIYVSANVAGTTYDRRLTFAAPHGFGASDIDRILYIYRYKKGASPAYRAAVFKIRQIIDATRIEVDVLWEYNEGSDGSNISGKQSYTWATGLFSATEGCRTVTFHEGRLVYGGFKRQPDWIALSVSDDFDNFQAENVDPDVPESFNDDKAIYRRTVSREINAIFWTVSTGHALVIGTAGAEFVLRGNADGILTPSSAVVKPATVRGSEPHVPVLVDGQIFFIERGGRRIRRFSYNFQADQFTADDATILCEHLFRDGVVELVYHQSPYSVIWCRVGSGDLVGLTFDSEQGVLAAHSHRLGGRSVDPNMPPRVESLCVIPGANGQDELWLAVSRHLNGANTRTVEVLSPPFRPLPPPEASRWELSGYLDDAYYVDCGVQYAPKIAIASITNASPAEVTTATPHGLAVGDTFRFRGVGGWSGRGPQRAAWGMAEVDQRSYRVRQVLSPTRFTVEELEGEPLNTLDYSSFSDPNGTAVVCRESATFGGLGWLTGSDVAIYGDGAYLGIQTVNVGTLELQEPVSRLAVGLPYTTLIETMRLSLGDPRNSSQGKPAAVPRVSLLLLNTAGGRIGRGPVPQRLDAITPRLGGDAMDRPAPMFTGDYRMVLSGSWDAPSSILIEVDEPVAFTLLGLAVVAMV